MSEADAVRPGWRLMWGTWHYFDRGRSTCGKFKMTPKAEGGKRNPSPRYASLTAQQREKWHICAACDPKPATGDAFNVGDVIALGPHPTVPAEMVGKFFRVDAVSDGAVRLSRPYEDEALTVPYRGKPRQP